MRILSVVSGEQMTNRGADASFLEELKSKNDIVSIVSKYITLNKRGANYWACCPFHGEKTPSFSVRDDRQFFKCFGCGESGDVISFVQKIENVDFITAVKILCDNCGMQLPEIEQTDEEKLKKKEKDRCLLANEEACKFYNQQLFATKDPRFISYIKSRALSRELVDTFRIGISPDFDSVIKHLHKQGFTDDELIKFGLAGKTEKGRVYDFYAERLIFPIMNSLGQVVGFSARLVDPKAKFAKYKNTPQTILFTKGQIMYGINNVRNMKRQGELKNIILVEGQMDVIACYKAGFHNVVGSMGTALTQQHADELYRMIDRITLCLDGDSAGLEATIRAINILKKKGFDINVARLTGAKDPDEYINKFGASEFGKAMDNALPANDFILQSIANRYDMTNNIQRSKCVKYMLDVVAGFETDSEREIYLAVVQKLTGLSLSVLKNDLNKLVNKEEKANDKIATQEPATEVNDSVKNAIYYILAYLIYQNKSMPDAEYLDKVLLGELRQLKDYIQSQKGMGKPVNVASLFDMFDVKPNSDIDKIINYRFDINEQDKEKYFNDCLHIIEKAYYSNEEKRLTGLLKTTKSADEMNEILKQLAIITKKLK